MNLNVRILIINTPFILDYYKNIYFFNSIETGKSTNIFYLFKALIAYITLCLLY